MLSMLGRRSTYSYLLSNGSVYQFRQSPIMITAIHTSPRRHQCFTTTTLCLVTAEFTYPRKFDSVDLNVRTAGFRITD